jgi:dTDP-4-amino-4,6-dideoxygalactose transaminase
MEELGFNYRLPDILCALGISQLATAAALDSTSTGPR